MDDTDDASEDGGNAEAAPRSTRTQGVADPHAGAVHVWSRNGCGPPVLVRGRYPPDETRTRLAKVRRHSAARGVTGCRQCGGDDRTGACARTISDVSQRAKWHGKVGCIQTEEERQG